ncbi:hypothetical protein [Actinopolymorpha alba]|uniref:hypothetical protein n=1 Tax=Actinopolymorpha alba TaxID=533267 RepID=UPI00037E0E48|nr:hypothetical protein [Actinopolymorpha alba]
MGSSASTRQAVLIALSVAALITVGVVAVAVANGGPQTGGPTATITVATTEPTKPSAPAEKSPAEKSPAETASPTCGPSETGCGKYKPVNDLCERADFSAIKAIAQFDGKLKQNGPHGPESAVYKSVSCMAPVTGTVDGQRASGYLRVEVQYLPHPAVAQSTYPQQVRSSLGEAKRVREVLGDWEQARAGIAVNRISPTASPTYVRMVLQDSNLVLAIDFSLSSVNVNEKAFSAVQKTAESILALSGS